MAGRSSEHFAVVESAIGGIGLAWSERGLARLQLPERDRETTAARLAARGGSGSSDDAGALPAFVGELVTLLSAYARGERVDFAGVPLDLAGARPFDLPVWRASCAIAWGETVTYGELTRRLGPPYVARAVGQALGRNPVPIIVPCHRIVAAGYRLGGFSAPGGAVTKERLLALEGVRVEAPAPLLDLMQRP